MNLPMPRFLHTPATRLARLVIALGLIGGLAGAPLAATDLHAYWDQRCAGCHGHAGDFSRRFLRVEGDRLLGWHQKERLPQFLRNHYAADEYADAIHAMLLAQLSGNRSIARNARAVTRARPSWSARRSSCATAA